MVYVGSSWVELDYWTSPSYGSYDARLRVLAYSTQDIASNTSRVYFKLQKRVTGGSAWNSDPLDFSITGYGAKNDGHSATQTWTFGSVSSTSWADVGGDTSDMYWSSVKHNDNGTLTLTATAEGDRVLGGAFDTDITIELPTIPRASVPTVTPNPVTLSQGNTDITIDTHRKSSSFTHQITLSYSDWADSSPTTVEDSVGMQLPYSLISKFPANAKTASLNVSCKTFNGSTTIGTKSTTVTMQVDSSIEHVNIGTVTIVDANTRTSTVTQDNSIYIANISTLQATIPLTVSGTYTELASAVVSCGNTSQTYTLSGTSQTITFEFDKVNASSLTVKVTDKRGNSVTGSKSWTLIQYQPVTTTATVGRPSATGSVGVGQVTGMAYGGDFGATQNSLTIEVDFKKHDDVDYDAQGTETYTLALTQDGYNSWSDALTFVYSLDYQYQYDIRFTVSDLFSTATYVAQLMQGLPILSWDETEVDIWGNLHIHDRENPYTYQNVLGGFDAILAGGAKNMLKKISSTTTSQGVTFTPQADGSVKVVGTATAEAWSAYSSITLAAGEYALSGSTYGVDIELWNDTGSTLLLASVDGDSPTFTVNTSTTYRVYCRVAEGDTVNTTVYPMIRDARIMSDAFLPYAPSNLTLLDLISALPKIQFGSSGIWTRIKIGDYLILFGRTTGGSSIQFGVTFASTPIVVCSPTSHNNNVDYKPDVRVPVVNTSNCYIDTNYGSTTKYNVSVLVIGRYTGNI